jgi:hypothetical protein
MHELSAHAVEKRSQKKKKKNCGKEGFIINALLSLPSAGNPLLPVDVVSSPVEIVPLEK